MVGLIVVLVFVKMGVEVFVFEQVFEIKEVGVGIQIMFNGVCVLEVLGCGNVMEEVLLCVVVVVLMDGIMGKLVICFDLSVQIFLYCFFYWVLLIGLIGCVVQVVGVKVYFGVWCISVLFEGMLIMIEGQVEFDFCFGVDGIYLICCMFVLFLIEVQFIGQVVWWVVIFVWEIVFEVCIWMVLGWYVVIYFLKDDILNIVVVEECDEWVNEGWYYFDDFKYLWLVFEGCVFEL